MGKSETFAYVSIDVYVYMYEYDFLWKKKAIPKLICACCRFELMSRNIFMLLLVRVFTVEDMKETGMGEKEEKLHWIKLEVSVNLCILIVLYIFSSSRKI